MAAPALPQGFGAGQVEKQVEGLPAAKPAPRAAPLPESAQTRVTLQAQSFVLSGVLVEGATVYHNLDFLPQYRDYLGHRITVQDLSRIADAITRKYHDDGYFLSHTLLPAQRIEFGIVRIRVIEGYIARWQVTGGSRADDPLLDKILDSVTAQRPLRRATLDAAFHKLAVLPDLSIHPYVRPLDDPLGAYVLELSAQRRRFAGAISIDNHGSEYIGPVEGVLALSAFDLTGHHESYQLKFATTSETGELHYYEFNSGWLIGTGGAVLQFGAARTLSYPGSLLKPLDAHIENERLFLGLLYPLQRTSDTAATAGLELSSYRSRTDLFGVKRLEDELHSLKLSYRYVHQPEENSTHVVSAALVQGLDVAGSKVVDVQNGSGIGQADFSKLTLDYEYLHVFRRRWEALVQIDGQYAADALPSSERYSLGGAGFGRAYDPSEITGDHGLAGRLELDYLYANGAGTRQLSPYVFYDLGKVWQVEPEVTGEEASLASAGLGARLAAAGVSAYLEAARPLTRPVASQGADGKDLRVFAGLSYEF
jgi:hemolysin activation/secretion protein